MRKVYLLLILIIPFLPNAFGYHDFDGPVFKDGEYRFRIQEAGRVAGFDYSYDLKTILPKEKLILDCQSFIQGLHIFWEEEQAGGILLSEGECQFIAYHVFTTLGQNQDLCLKVNPESFEIKVGDDPDNCYK